MKLYLSVRPLLLRCSSPHIESSIWQSNLSSNKCNHNMCQHWKHAFPIFETRSFLKWTFNVNISCDTISWYMIAPTFKFHKELPIESSPSEWSWYPARLSECAPLINICSDGYQVSSGANPKRSSRGTLNPFYPLYLVVSYPYRLPYDKRFRLWMISIQACFIFLKSFLN